LGFMVQLSGLAATPIVLQPTYHPPTLAPKQSPSHPCTQAITLPPLQPPSRLTLREVCGGVRGRGEQRHRQLRHRWGSKGFGWVVGWSGVEVVRPSAAFSSAGSWPPCHGGAQEAPALSNVPSNPKPSSCLSFKTSPTQPHQPSPTPTTTAPHHPTPKTKNQTTPSTTQAWCAAPPAH